MFAERHIAFYYNVGVQHRTDSQRCSRRETCRWVN